MTEAAITYHRGNTSFMSQYFWCWSLLKSQLLDASTRIKICGSDCWQNVNLNHLINTFHTISISGFDWKVTSIHFQFSFHVWPHPPEICPSKINVWWKIVPPCPKLPQTCSTSHTPSAKSDPCRECKHAHLDHTQALVTPHQKKDAVCLRM